MSTVAWLMIAYFSLARLSVIASIGRSFEITYGVAVADMLIGALLVWGVVSLATS